MNFIYGLMIGGFLTFGEILGGMVLLPFLIAAFFFGIYIFYCLSVWYDASLTTSTIPTAWFEYPWSWLPGANWVTDLMHALFPNQEMSLNLLAPSDSSVFQQINSFLYKANLAILAAIINLTIIAAPVAMIFKILKAALSKQKAKLSRSSDNE